jgi:opacity protein-like surface antigen
MNNTRKLFALLAVSALASLASAQANLIVNGGFETVGNGQATQLGYDQGGGTWGKFYGSGGPNSVDTVDGWTSFSPKVPIELGKPTTYGVTAGSGPSLGNAVMELDTDENIVAGQFFSGSTTTYTLQFYYAQRANVSGASGKFKVFFNDIQVGTEITPSSTTMTLWSGTVSGISGINTLKFQGTGTSDSFGVLIDNVAVVPEPSTYIAGGLALLPLLFGLRSRFAKK